MALFILASLISCATATSSASSSLATPTGVLDTTTPYFIELLGYNYVDGNGGQSDWGVTAQDESGWIYLADPDIGEVFSPDEYRYNWTACNQTMTSQNVNEILNVSRNSGPDSATLISQTPSVPLALGWTLQEPNSSSHCTSFKEIETVPFGINIGNRKKYNGSLVLGGYYDANRIASTAWHLIPESVGNSNFLYNGSLQTSVVVGNQTFDAILDYKATAGLFFPVFELYGACNNDSYTISFPGTNGEENLEIPFNLKNYYYKGLCHYNGDSETPGAPVYLGLPFFQAVYTYVDKMGQIYMTAANDLEAASVSMKPFEANATLDLPAGVTVYTASAATPTKKSAACSHFAPTGSFLSLQRFGWYMTSFGLLVVASTAF